MQEGNLKNIWSISRVADTLAPVTVFLEYHLNKLLWSHTNRNTNVREELLALAHGFRRCSPWSLNSMSLTSWLLPYHGSVGLWWRDFSMEDCQQTKLGGGVQGGALWDGDPRTDPGWSTSSLWVPLSFTISLHQHIMNLSRDLPIG